MNDGPLTFFCDACGNLTLIEFKADDSEKCLTCRNREMEKALRRRRTPSLEEVRKPKPPNFHDD
jgi:hypothetical protein